MGDLHNLEELIYQKKSKTEIFKELKKHLKEYKLSLTAPSSSAASFLYKHTKKIDEFITLLYKLALRDAFEQFMPLSSQIPLTVCALGSYGREELCVYSDIDIMLCYKEIKGYNIKPIIEAILYASWDLDLKLGHRVHEVSELQQAAEEDITIKSAMIESRFICGSKHLWFEIENELNKIRKHKKKAYILEKIDELEKRYEKHPISFEPNIKESRGGLRDANTLFWILNVKYGIKSLKDAPKGLFEEHEYREFKLAFEFLQKVRVVLHQLEGKKSDVLSFANIVPAAKKLSLSKGSEQKIQFDFFKRVLEAFFTIERFCRIAISKTGRNLFVKHGFVVVKAARVRKNIFLVEGKLYAKFNIQPIALCEILEIMAAHPGVKYGDSFLEAAKNSKNLKTLDERPIKLFRSILENDRCYDSLMLLYKASKLHILLPPFKKILFLPQFDLYHQYPVDIHTLRTLYFLENIENNEVRAVYESLPPQDKLLVKFTLLFHDIGKGRMQEHALLGKTIWQKYAPKYGIEDIETGSRLILHHVAMSYTAQREDIYNENTLSYFASILKDKRSLDLLLVLTYCDINGVGRNILNQHTMGLLLTLYKNSIDLFENKELLNEAEQRAKKEKLIKRNPKFEQLSFDAKKKVFKIDTNMIYQKEKSDQIIQITERAIACKDFSFFITNGELLKLEIYRKIPLNLGYLLGKLSHLNIASMDIYKLFDGVKYFKIEFIEHIEKEDEFLLAQLIEDSFDMEKKANIKKPALKKRHIAIKENHSRTLARIDIEAKDQKGLLAYFGTVFDRLGLEIVSTKIHTTKGVAKDMFLIEKNGNFWNNKEKIITSLLD